MTIAAFKGRFHACGHDHGDFFEAAAKPPKHQRGDRRIVCAAIRAADGDLLLGIRHYSPDMRQQIEQRMDGPKFHSRGDDDQGFVDQFGRWLSRREAYKLAEANGQLLYPDACGKRLDVGPVLYSEGLY